MSEHYFTKKPTSGIIVKEVNVSIRGQLFRFKTASGVFSSAGIDKGSLLLAESAIIKDNWNILDLGCGWGLIGIVIKKTFPKVSVLMTDINERAISLTRQNAKNNNVSVEIRKNDLYESMNERFDTIIVNPPMKAGRELCYKVIRESKSVLKKGGLLQLVALHNKGGSMLEKKMKEILGNVKTIAKKAGFRVYVAEY